MINRYPWWKNLLLAFAAVLGIIYALPNVYGEDPAVQISGRQGSYVDESTQHSVENTLATAGIHPKSIELLNQTLLIRFFDTDIQLKAKDLIKSSLGDNYTVALNLASTTPAIFSWLGAQPMKLGLDLRGGIQFTLEVDVASVMQQRMEGVIRNISTELRENNLRYMEVTSQKQNVAVKFQDPKTMEEAYYLIHRHYPELQLTQQTVGRVALLSGQWTPQAMTDIQQQIIDQTMTTLRNRVNELGIAEAVVQQQGLNRISVELPGIQDSARAQQILGGTATLEFRMVDQEHDPMTASRGATPPGATLYTYENHPVLLKNQVILTGNSITNASATYGEDARAAVDVTLGGGGEAMFHRLTAQNIGKLMAIVYVETKQETKLIDNQPFKIKRKQERVISVATIKSALPSRFEISGLSDPAEAQNLALLLRAGALPASIDVIAERTLGPQLGMENIQKGILSVEIGSLVVVIFMAIYYHLFGLIADLAIAVNLILLVALLSVMGMTLTLPGIAGIVLTVGMAVDANVLIFERIREELRNGTTVQASIHAGYEKAFSTIVDANVTTLIAALVLFGVGTGAVKGFAVTLSIGLMTSMLSAIGFTRAIVNAVYGAKPVKSLSIGI